MLFSPFQLEDEAACYLGKRLAQAEIRNALAMIFTEFEFHCEEKGKPIYNTVLQPVGRRASVKRID